MCNNNVPKIYKVTKIELDDTTQEATFTLCSELPKGTTCPVPFCMKLNPCQVYLCNGYSVKMVDSVGNTFSCGNRLGNDFTLSQATAQVLRFGIIHAVLSSDYPAHVLIQDRVLCSPTPVFTSTASTASATNAKTRGK